MMMISDWQRDALPEKQKKQQFSCVNGSLCISMTWSYISDLQKELEQKQVVHCYFAALIYCKMWLAFLFIFFSFFFFLSPPKCKIFHQACGRITRKITIIILIIVHFGLMLPRVLLPSWFWQETCMQGHWHEEEVYCK